jgi:hypothetical protein
MKQDLLGKPKPSEESVKRLVWQEAKFFLTIGFIPP